VSGYTGEGQGGLETSPGIPPTNLPRAATAVLDRTPGIPQKPSEKVPRNDYLDYIAKPLAVEANSGIPGTKHKCGWWSLVGEDEDGNRVAKRLCCGRQWCGTCRDITQNRKIARLLPRVQQFETMGFFIVRPPWELMPLLRTKRQRACFVKGNKRAFRTIGYVRGLTLIHDFGERSPKYAFHLQVLVDGGYLSPEALQRACWQLRRLIYPRWVVEKYGDKLDINYHYRQSPAEMMHTLRYCTKATFTDKSWDQELAGNLYGAHYSSWWGKWDEEPKWQLAESDKKLASLVALEQGQHPISGKPIRWNKHPLPTILLTMDDWTDLGNGYSVAGPIRSPPAPSMRPLNLTELPDGDYRKQSNLVKRHGERATNILSTLDDYETGS